MTGKVVVITGASSGIGAALAGQLAAEGASLALVARRTEQLQSVADRCGERALPIVADVTSREAVRRVVREALGRFGHIDVWINNAGRGISLPPSRLTDEDVDEMMAVNVKSVLYGLQEVLPHFIERGEGHVINVSSLLGRVPFAPIRSAYSGAKHFMNALTAMFREEIAESHPRIAISIVSPPVVRTEFGLKARHGGPDSRTLPNSQSAEEVAAAIVGVIRSRKPDVYTLPGAQARVAAYYAGLGEDA